MEWNELVTADPEVSVRARCTAVIILAATAVLTTGLESVDGRSPIALHTELISSKPADGDSLTTSPPEVRLVFSGPVEPALSVIRLVTADGAQLELNPSGENESQVLVARLPGLGNGAYTIEWSTVSADGHNVEGRLAFQVAREELPIDTSTVAHPTAPTEMSQPPSDNSIVGIGVLSGLAIGALLALAGLLAHMTRLGADDLGRMRRVASVLALMAPLLLAAHAIAWVQSIAPLGKLDGETMSAVLDTMAGRHEVIRLTLATMAAVVFAVFRRPALAAGLAIVAVAIGGGLGHAVEFYPAISIPIKAVHLIAVALWLGGLISLAACALPASGFHHVAHQTSKLALWAVAAVVVTGFAQSALIAGSPINLLGTRYGALLGAKTVGLVGLVMFGARNRGRLLPLLDEDTGSKPLTRSVAWETALMVLVLIVAGVLAATPPPGG
jgi:copper transport protein